MAKLASQADVCYNKPIKLFAQAMLEASLSMTIQHRVKGQLYRMDTLSPHADNGNPQSVTIPMNLGNSAIVDLEDADLARWKWYTDKDGYALRSSGPRGHMTSISMHRIILERKLGRPIPSKIHVDHINGNPRDNRRGNLREANVSQNLANQKKSHRKKSSVSSFKGVALRSGHWQASISYQGYRHYLGLFDTPELAAQTYDQAALELYGEYAATNFPDVQMSLQSVIRKPGQIVGRNKESGYRGVWKDSSNRWAAMIGVGGKIVRLGTFADKVEAARAYDKAVIAIKGERALTNFPLEDYGLEVNNNDS